MQDIKFYQKRLTPHPDWKKFDAEYDVEQHEIFTNKFKYPDRREVVSEYEDEAGNKVKKKDYVDNVKIGIPYQQYINEMAVTFLFGTPVKYEGSGEIYNAFMKVIEKNKMVFFDRELANKVGRYTEAAELWYTIPEKNKYYGFESEFALKCKLLTPDKCKMYPMFDDNDNLIAFSREFVVEVENKKVTYFETYTDTEIFKWVEDNNKWGGVEGYPIKNPIGKIPIVLVSQEKVEWYKARTQIGRLEENYSRRGDSNDRFAYPLLAIRGSVAGQFTQQNSGRIVQLDGENSGLEYVSPPQANESLDNEFKDLHHDIRFFTHTMDVSPESFEGMGNLLSGVAAKFIFMLPHIKVAEKEAIYTPALQRRISIVKAFLQTMKTGGFEDTVITPKITPFVIDTEQMQEKTQ